MCVQLQRTKKVKKSKVRGGVKRGRRTEHVMPVYGRLRKNGMQPNGNAEQNDHVADT